MPELAALAVVQTVLVTAWDLAQRLLALTVAAAAGVVAVARTERTRQRAAALVL